MNVATATAIIEQAIEDEIWESDVPDDEDETIADAEEIIAQAQDAIADGTSSEEIDRVIAIFEAADKPKRKLGAAAKKAAPAAKAKPAAKKAPAKAGRPAKKAPEPEPDEEENELASVEPWAGYDDDKPAEIVESIGVLAEALDDEDESENAAETLQHISIYEPANKNRVKIVDALADIVGEVADAESAADDDDDDDDEVTEPIEGYEDLTIKEIKGVLEDFIADADNELDEKVELLDGTIAYEGSRGKPRKTLINYLNGLKDGLEEEDGEEDEADDAPAEKPAARGKGRGAKTGASAGGRASSAGKSAGVNGDEAEADELTGGYSIKFKIGRSTSSVDVEGKNAAAGYVLDLLDGGATSVTVDVAA